MDADALAALLAGARDGRAASLARLLSIVEDGSPDGRALMRLVAPLAGSAVVVGVTGPPGVGKSTTTSALVTAFRARGQRVGVLAIDPSSPFSGGALLGDRVRMSEHATDAGVFVRSMAARGHLGGLAAATPQAIRVLAAGGYEVVIVETVGVGQSEVEIAGSADVTLVLVAPGMGDSVQAAKAGVLEIADVLVVNKADLAGADATVRELRSAVAMRPPTGWSVPVVRTVAASGGGVDDLVEHVDACLGWLRGSGGLERRRTQRARAEIRALAVQSVVSRIDPARLDALAARVVAGDLDAFAAAAELVSTS